MKNRIAILTALMLGLLLVLPGSVRAQDEDEQPEQPGGQPSEGPPAEGQQSQGVGRVSVINGNVSTQRGDSGDWVAATVNQPVVKLDQVMTAERSRTEIQLDFGHTARLAEKTTTRFADLTPSNIQLQIAMGTVDFSIYPEAEGNVEIDTPNMAVHPTEPGFYRVQVNSDSETQLIVFRGRADVATQEGSVTVEPGQNIMVQGTQNPQYQTDRAPAQTGFDEWALSRDRDILNAKHYDHTNRYYTGSEDMQGHGQWEQVPGYDWCWTPAVDSGWVPYNDGRWVYEPYWGWTWVSFEPWGWAPYHYGRWFNYGNRWRWWPGAMGVGYRPMWAPAYVSFIGFGGRRGGFGVGFGFGNIGWVPLGPADRFHPWWGGRNSYNVVNITNINNARVINGRNFGGRQNPAYGSNLQNALTNDHIRRAISTMPSNQFGTAATNYKPAEFGELRQGQMIHGTVPVVPTKASLGNPARMSGFSNRQLAAANNTRFYSRNPVTSAPAGSFNQHVSGIQQMMRQGPAASGNMRPATLGAPNQTGRFENGAAQPRPLGGNTATPGVPQRNGNMNTPSGAPGGANGSVNWQKFGNRPAPTAQGGAVYNAPRPAQPQSNAPSQGATNWNRFPSMGGASSNRTGSGLNSNGAGRAPLNIGKPIVSERPAGNGGSTWGGNRGGSYNRPAPQPRTGGSGGGNGGHSQPAPQSRGSWGGGGGHSSPAPAPHSSGGGGGGHNHR